MSERIKLIEDENITLDRHDGVLPLEGLLVKIYCHNMDKGKQLKKQILGDYFMGDLNVKLGIEGTPYEFLSNCKQLDELKEKADKYDELYKANSFTMRELIEKVHQENKQLKEELGNVASRLSTRALEHSKTLDENEKLKQDLAIHHKNFNEISIIAKEQDVKLVKVNEVFDTIYQDTTKDEIELGLREILYPHECSGVLCIDPSHGNSKN